MKFKHLAVGPLLVAGMAVLPVGSMAATSQSCAPGKVTSESYTWDFKAEASKLLDGIRADAVQTRNRAETIATFNMKPAISWQTHAAQLTPSSGRLTIWAGRCAGSSRSAVWSRHGNSRPLIA